MIGPRDNPQPQTSLVTCSAWMPSEKEGITPGLEVNRFICARIPLALRLSLRCRRRLHRMGRMMQAQGAISALRISPMSQIHPTGPMANRARKRGKNLAAIRPATAIVKSASWASSNAWAIEAHDRTSLGVGLASIRLKAALLSNFMA